MIQYRAGIFHKKIIKKELKFFHKVKKNIIMCAASWSKFFKTIFQINNYICKKKNYLYL